MQKRNNKITLKSYLDLHQLLEKYRGSHEENRIFSLSKAVPGTTPNKINLLLAWKDENLYRVTDELVSEKYLHYWNIASFLIGSFTLLLGFFSGFALLSYSGAQPVNILYLLLVMVALPLLSMSLTLLSMFTGNIGANLFNHFSPIYYLEKVLNFFPFSKEVKFETLPFSATFSKWLFLQRLQLFSFLFALGLFVALLIMVITKDIAFGWSTTLQIDPSSFQTLLNYLSYPWHGIFPSAVPSLELIEMSHYFRLGEKLDANMIHNADKLGAWWKFLAMATFTYALLLRLVFWFWTHYGLERALKKEFLAIDGAKQLLVEFAIPYVSTRAQNIEEHLDVSEQELTTESREFSMEYHALLGWNYSESELLSIEDRFNIKASIVKSVGGRNSFKEDQQILSSLEDSVLLYVKAWEPPTMDFIDFIEELLLKKELHKVDVCPLGTVSNNYKRKKSDLEVWLKKLEQIDSDKLGVIDV